MNILYFSSLINSYSSGTSWSVPALIKAQEKVDNCFWIETNNSHLPAFLTVKCFHRISDTGHRLSRLPHPFNNPDIVVFVGVYSPLYLLISKELSILNVPYIIRPTGSLTFLAQHNHAFFKKKIANYLLFNRFVKNAEAIHYLTEDEQKDSGMKWNNYSYVLPNGINIPSKRKVSFSSDGIKAVFIGRIEVHQKGLDLLLEAVGRKKNVLKESGFSLKIYGPIDRGAKPIFELIKYYQISDIVSLYGEVTGENKESVLLDSDLFLLTSRFEGHSMALLEALSYGLPVATTPGANMKQKIRQYDAGWCSDETSVESICNMLLTIIRDTDSFATKGRNAIELAKTYNYDEIAKQFHEIAQDIVNGNYR